MEFIQLMEIKKRTFLTHPTKKHFILVTSAWAASTILLVLTITDFFKESLYQVGFLMLYVLMPTATATAIQVWFNYIRRIPIDD